MNALLPSSTFVLATRNRHKPVEIRGILGDACRCLTLNDFPSAPEVIEDSTTFAGNATKKAVEIARWLAPRISNFKSEISNPLWVLADDSGLEVDALNGAPGVHSARFAAPDTGASDNSPDADNNAKLLRLLKDLPPAKRAARFRCVLALTPVLPVAARNASPVCYADEFEMQTRLFDGACEGHIGFASRGRAGFGYDPLFIPDGFEQTFAELGEEVKNRLSHRARAIMKLKETFSSR
jgi:XTP/dITP diphosphohydrolase